MPLRAWNGSAFTTAKSAKVWNGSSWVNAKSAKVWNGSSWVNFLSSVNIDDVTDYVTSSGYEQASAFATYYILDDGTVKVELDGSDTGLYVSYSSTWLLGGVNSDMSVRFTLLNWSGNYPSGSFGTWFSLGPGGGGSVGTFGGAATTSGSITNTGYVNFRVELAYTADTSTILDSAIIDLTALATAYA